ncbi:hypothetical protein C1I98_08365 [Spongiactinospora gelatinilytica]|uniref:NADAR domain-containing protein n=1 Tax=Spongiactinospora gelatinilytica TaxID=2666298 RepID=A0A2W2GUA5_9ACTN|nr:hypothetical protein C1I98_08365 [Spongiactinospora gelatinilytica]
MIESARARDVAGLVQAVRAGGRVRYLFFWGHRPTGERVLVEAGPTDRIWGIGMTASDVRAERPHEWAGRNLLGFALMEARAVLAGAPG